MEHFFLLRVSLCQGIEEYKRYKCDSSFFPRVFPGLSAPPLDLMLRLGRDAWSMVK